MGQLDLDADKIEALEGRACQPRQIEALIERRPERIVDAELVSIGAGTRTTKESPFVFAFNSRRRE